MNKKTIKKIKRKLKKGDQKRIAMGLGFSDSYVNKVLNGRRNNIEILIKANQISLENEHKEAELAGRAS
jgi:transcriptional regulator with XRE-family HTH domain